MPLGAPAIRFLVGFWTSGPRPAPSVDVDSDDDDGDRVANGMHEDVGNTPCNTPCTGTFVTPRVTAQVARIIPRFDVGGGRGGTGGGIGGSGTGGSADSAAAEAVDSGRLSVSSPVATLRQQPSQPPQSPPPQQHPKTPHRVRVIKCPTEHVPPTQASVLSEVGNFDNFLDHFLTHFSALLHDPHLSWDMPYSIPMLKGC